MNHKNERLIFMVLFFLILQFDCFAQNELKRNQIFSQLGGNGLILSLNYERQIFQKPNFRIHVGAGFYGRDKQFLTIPLGLNHLLKLKKKSYLDAGLGMTYTKAEAFYYVSFKLSSTYIENQPHFIVVPSVSYRYLPNENIILKIGFTPVIINFGFIPMIGFSFGHQF